MLQILTLTVTALQKELFISFMLIVNNMLDMFEVLNEKFEYYVKLFHAAYDHMNYVYEKFDVKFYTEKVQNWDKQRVTAFRKLRDMIRFNQTYPENEAKGEAARILLEIIKLYRCSEISQLKMSERTAVLPNLIEDFEDKYNEQVLAIGVGDLLAELRQAQDEFMKVYLDRSVENADQGLNAMADARKLMTEAYRDLVTAINLEAKRDTDGELTDFINMLNVEIRKNFINTGQSLNSSTGTGESGETNIPIKTATFTFKSGDQVKLRVEVGTVLIAPNNTEGYKWKPEVPELMPAKNLTFREVPIEEREATATFHFFDHTEEEIKQVVGSALTAPANTEGYYWDPAVPATMPEEDTSYYELPVAQEEGGEGQEEEEEYTVTYHNDNGEVITTQRYKVGQTIVPPTPPAGFEWGYLPIVMPARNLNIYPIDPETGA